MADKPADPSSPRRNAGALGEDLRVIAQQLLEHARRASDIAPAASGPGKGGVSDDGEPGTAAERRAHAARTLQWERRLTEKSEAIAELRSGIERIRRSHERQSAAYLAELRRLHEQLDELKARVENFGRDAGSRSRHHRRFAIYSSSTFNDAWITAQAETAQELHMDAPIFARTNFQPAFTPHPDGEYQLLEFLALHDRAFVRAAYIAILRREPDREGEAHYLAQIRSGENKAKLLDQFLQSEESRRHRTVIHGLDKHLRFTRLCEKPVIGRFVEAAVFLANVRGHLRDLRVLENHVIRIAEETQALNESNLSKLRALSK